MVICPNCRATLPQKAAYCSCGIDLSVLVYLDQLPDHFYNKAIAAYRSGDLRKSVELVAVTLALRPGDAEAERMKNELWQSIFSESSKIEKK